MDDLSIGAWGNCRVVLSPFTNLLLFRFCVLGLFKDLSLFILWQRLKNQGRKWVSLFRKLGWQGFCSLNVCAGRDICIPLCSQLSSCSSVKGWQNRWMVTILGWEQSRRRGDCSCKEQSVASAFFIAAASAFFTAAAGVKPSVPEFCQHVWITLTGS